MRAAPWLLRRPGPQRALRLYCFSYAGGSPGQFLDWQAALGPQVEVCAIQLPGRGARFSEAPCSSLPQLVDTLAAVLAAEPDLPFAFFGHSLGGLIAFELARRLAAGGHAMPQHLFISGCAAPRERAPRVPVRTLDDAALLRKLAHYNGTPPELLAHAELMELLLPAIRADFALADDYVYRPGPPLALPLTILAGRADRIDRAGAVDGWARESTGPCRVHWFDGDHFFINSQRQAVLDCMARELAGLPVRRLQLAL